MTVPVTPSTRPVRKFMFALLISALCTGGFSLIVLMATGYDEHDIGMRLMLTSILALVYACIVLVCIAPIERGRQPLMMWSTIGLATGVAIGWGAMLWRDNVPDYPVTLSFLGSATLLLVGMFICGQLFAQQVPWQWLSICKNLLAILTLGFIAFCISLIWTTWWVPIDGLIVGVTTTMGMALFTAILSVASFIRALNRKRSPAATESVSTRPKLRMTCPRCAHEQVLKVGPTRCAKCRLGLIIAITEPRCECGYLLYQLQSDVCPECGRAVAAISSPSETQ
jgi:hypothetical protein